MLPWVQNQRMQMADKNDPYAQQWMSCDDCMGWLTSKERAAWRCGWLPESRRCGKPPAPWVGKKFGGPEPTICPGYSISLPIVYETARAYGWSERSMLREYFGTDDLPQIVFDYLDLLGGELSMVERFAVKEMKAQ